MKEKKRSSGILMPVFSLPSKYGIGSLGEEAYRFIDFLSRAKQSYWQTLPLGPTGYGDSPYQSFSSYAGNPYFIDLDILAERGLLNGEEIWEHTINTERIDYEYLYENRFTLLRIAFSRADMNAPEIIQFREKESYWIEDYANYMALKLCNDNKPWYEWEDMYKDRDYAAIEAFRNEHIDEINFQVFMQYEFYSQWHNLKNYAKAKGIEIIGDLPIYIASDSASIWVTPNVFQLDEDNIPARVGGVPPDYFNAEGQLWGNPLYDTEVLRNTNYKWWIERLRGSLELFDIIRLDHFRGFESFYSIEYGSENAKLGLWEKGLGMEFIDRIKNEFGVDRFIAEDLGFLTEDVVDLLNYSEFPGMAVLQFGFTPHAESSYLPHNHVENLIIYLGTHDNDTAMGYFNHISYEEREYISSYFKLDGEEGLNWGLIRGLMQSVARTSIIQVQDLLGLGNEARINIPGTTVGNWQWQMESGALDDELSERLKFYTELYSRGTL